MSTDPQKSNRFSRLKDAGEFVFAAVVTVFGIFGYFVVRDQLRVMQQQTKVMQDQLSDARRAASESNAVTARTLAALEKQANASKTLAETSRVMATEAEVSAAATEKLARATAKAAEASNDLAASAAQSSDASRRLADAAHEANDMSRQLLAVARQTNDTNRTVQRAFVFSQGVDLVRTPDTRHNPQDLRATEWAVLVRWGNSGDTPTRDLTIKARCWLDYWGVAKDRPDAFDVATIKPSDKFFLTRNPDLTILLGPKQSSVYAGGCSVRRLDLMLREPGIVGIDDQRWYIFGTATYRDVFNPQYLHRTDFCYVAEITGSMYADDPRLSKRTKEGLNLKPLETIAYPCNKHNCADEECKGEPVLP